MPTLKDVARLACVDVSTVSRALNNNPCVHAETKARIMAAVEKLSYRPNLLAKGLRQGKRHTIGVVVPRLHLTVFSTVAQAIEEAARDQGYATLLCSTEDDPQMEKDGLSRLRNGLVDGILLAGTGKNKKLVRDIQASGIPVTQVIRIQDDTLSSVTVDYVKCGYEAVKYLYAKGSRHPGLITGSLKLSPYKFRYQGYKEALEELGLKEITSEAKGFTNSLEYGYQATRQMLQEHPELDAILAASSGCPGDRSHAGPEGSREKGPQKCADHQSDRSRNRQYAGNHHDHSGNARPGNRPESRPAGAGTDRSQRSECRGHPACGL